MIARIRSVSLDRLWPEEIDGARLDGLRMRGCPRVRYEHDMRVVVLRNLPVPQLETVDVGKFDVQHDAGGHGGFGNAMYR